METQYKTMKEIGSKLGLTSHQLGKALKQAGLRTTEGKPSGRAFKEKWVEQKFSDLNYLWAWHEEKVIKLMSNNV